MSRNETDRARAQRACGPGNTTWPVFLSLLKRRFRLWGASIQRLLIFQSEGRDRIRIDDGFAVGVLHRDAKAIVIIPHRPTDAIGFERCAHVMQPRQARGWRRHRAEGAELVADERNIVGLRPSGGLV